MATEFTNTFTHAKMDKLLEVSFAPATFVGDTLFKETNKTNEKFIVTDKVTHGRKLAAFASPLHEGVPVESEGYKTDVFQPAYTKEHKNSNAWELMQNRRAGEHPYQGKKSARAEAMEQMGKDITILDERLKRRVEKMCCELILTGKVVAKGRGIDIQYDFKLPDDNKLYVGNGIDTSWTNTSADMLENVEFAGDLVKKNTGRIPNLVILGRNLWKYFRKNEEVKELLDNRSINAGVLNLDLLPKTVKVLGDIAGYTFVQYCDYYEDDNGDLQDMFNPDAMVVTSVDLRASKEYGAIIDLDHAGGPKEKFVKSWIVKNPSAQVVLLQSSPLAVHHQLEGVVVVYPTKDAFQ